MIATLSNLGNKFRRLCQMSPEPVQRIVFDRDHSPGGKFHATEHHRWDLLYNLLAKHVNGGSLLNLGCGEGRTEEEINPGTCHTVVGVDVSPKAIALAMERNRNVNNVPTKLFIRSNFEKLHERVSTSSKFDVMLFRESLYYGASLTLPGLVTSLTGNYLKPGGTLIVTVRDDKHYYGNVIQPICNRYALIDRHSGRHKEEGEEEEVGKEEGVVWGMYLFTQFNTKRN